MASRRGRKRRDAKLAGFRSGFEQEVAQQAERDGIEYKYEAIVIKYQGAPRRYKPDFKLKNGIIVETKGRFKSPDRTKHLLIKEQYPELDIRFVFQADNKLSPDSDTRYSDWCEKHGFKYAFGSIPKEWASEPSRKRTGPKRAKSASGGGKA